MREVCKMALTDIFKIKELKNELEQANYKIQDLTKKSNDLEALLTPEVQDVQKRKQLVTELISKKENLEYTIEDLNSRIQSHNSTIVNLEKEIMSKKNEIIELDNQILLQDFGIYTPVYNLMNSEAYKDRLTVIRQRQKDMIKNDSACLYPTNMTLDGSAAKGKKLIKDNVKQILRSFNNECDAVIDKVKFNNIDAIRKKIEKSYNDLNKMNSSMQISIVYKYLELKLEELNLCYEYAIKKQEEKEEQKRIREQLREEARLQKELEEARKSIEKEKSHYENALHQLEQQLLSASDEDVVELETKKNAILSQLDEIQKSITDIDYRESNKRAGYVYIISNVGSFGENVYKIGMTRRLDPQDRVDELGDASVPFNFDIHAMIFSDDAPALENALHKAFEDKKVNMINHRREFFNVTLEEIEKVVRENFDKTVEFTEIAPAEQYRETLMLKKHIN